jgi:hypothetical protein
MYYVHLKKFGSMQFFIIYLLYFYILFNYPRYIYWAPSMAQELSKVLVKSLQMRAYVVLEEKK